MTYRQANIQAKLYEVAYVSFAVLQLKCVRFPISLAGNMPLFPSSLISPQFFCPPPLPGHRGYTATLMNRQLRVRLKPWKAHKRFVDYVALAQCSPSTSVLPPSFTFYQCSVRAVLSADIGRSNTLLLLSLLLLEKHRVIATFRIKAYNGWYFCCSQSRSAQS